MKYYFYIDESGDLSLTKINKDFPYFELCWVLISEEEDRKLKEEFKNLKKDIFEDEDIIFHSHEIRKQKNKFKILNNLELRAEFFEKFNNLVGKTKFTLFCAIVQKERYREKYWRIAINPYHKSLEYVLERVVRCVGDNDEIEIIVEKRWEKEDKLLLQHYNSIRAYWTYYMDKEKFVKIKKFDFRHKNQNDAGLQLSDMCAYPIIRYVMDPFKENLAYNIVEPKILCSDNWIKSGYGIKIIP